jgi:FkbM family methyltransferase
MITLGAPRLSGAAKRKGIYEPLAARPRSGMRTVPLAGEGYTAPHPILSPGLRNFLEGFKFGRWGIRAGRKIVRILQKLGNPVQRKLWIRRFCLPLRNAMLLNRPLTVSFNGIPVFLVPQGAIAGDIWAGIGGEKQEVSFILSLLDPGMIFFDVGTNAGLFAISAAKKIGGKGVFAFEARSSTCQLLKRNLLLNRLADVNVEQIALGDSVGEGVLQINARGKDGLNTSGQAIHTDNQVGGLEDARITTVDVFMKNHNVPRVDIMKVDLQGAELMLFRGARELLERADAPLILYEGFGFLTRGFGYHPVEILWFLESCGYTLFVLNSETGEISELKPDYEYDSMVIGAKPGHAWFASWRARLK